MRINEFINTKNLKELYERNKLAKPLNERHQLNEFVPVAVAAAASALGISADVLIGALGLSAATAVAVDMQQDPEKYTNLSNALIGTTGVLAATLLQQFATTPEEVDDTIISGAQAAREAEQAEQIEFLTSIGIPENNINTDISAYSPYQGMTAAEREERLMQDMARDAEFKSDSERRNFEIDMAAALDNTKRELQRSIEQKLEADGVTLNRETRENIRAFVNSGTAEELLSKIDPTEIQLSRSSETQAINNTVNEFVSGITADDISSTTSATATNLAPDAVRPTVGTTGSMPAATTSTADVRARPEGPAAGMPAATAEPLPTLIQPQVSDVPPTAPTATQSDDSITSPTADREVDRTSLPALTVPAADNTKPAVDTSVTATPRTADDEETPAPDLVGGKDIPDQTAPDLVGGRDIPDLPAPATGPAAITPPTAGTGAAAPPGINIPGLAGGLIGGLGNIGSNLLAKPQAATAARTDTAVRQDRNPKPKPKPKLSGKPSGSSTGFKSPLIRLNDPLDLRRNIDTWAGG
jgi:hypothetical protein